MRGILPWPKWPIPSILCDSYLQYLVPTAEAIGSSSSTIGLQVSHKDAHSVAPKQAYTQVISCVALLEEDEAWFTKHAITGVFLRAWWGLDTETELNLVHSYYTIGPRDMWL